MQLKDLVTRRRSGRLVIAAAVATLSAGAAIASAMGGGSDIFAGNLLISRSVYAAPSITAGATGVTGTQLPPGCTDGACAPANTGSTYPQVFNNDEADSHFGITSPIYLDQVDPDTGHLINTIPVPTSGVVTSFSSKSELALNLSTNGEFVSFMGYAAPPATLDVSNANTPGEIDPSNPDVGPWYRVVATLGSDGDFRYTETNAYTGDNGRAAIIADGNPAGGNGDDHNGFGGGTQTAPVAFMAGNAGSGSGKKQFPGVIEGAGAQALSPSIGPEAFQNPGGPTPVGSFNITQLASLGAAYAAGDKIGKDTNFRGLTIYNNVVYYTKGSGGNGVNTVYFIDTTGKACPNGVGLPVPGAALPSAPIAYNLANIPTEGVFPYNMCVLAGFPTVLAAATTGVSYPFGIWFANANTIYLADEGSGDNTYDATTNTYTVAAGDTTAGLQKWVFNSTSKLWQLAYTLQDGLALGVPYTVAGYPTGDNTGTFGTGLPWAPATDGLRNITGRVNRNGTATVWAVTSTVSGSGDEGADPNKVVAITDPLGATTPGTHELFTTVEAARDGEVLRGVSFTPGTDSQGQH